MNKGVLSIDFGASSGRAILFKLNDGKVTSREVRRFSNDMIYLQGTYYWDVLRLWYEIQQSLIAANGEYESVAIDTWGVDFVLVRDDDKLIENPISYRDERHSGMVKLISKSHNLRNMYNITGSQVVDLVTAFQLYSLKLNRKEILDATSTILPMPDYFSFLLTGVKSCEMSIASTTNLLDVNSKNWSDELIKDLGFNSNWFPQIVKSGTVIGEISDDLCKTLNIQKAKVIKVCSHDTQSAAVSLPTLENNPLFLSTGTWALCGVELDNPVLDDKSYELNLTNEVGYDNKITLLKNLNGLYFLQELRKGFKNLGKNYSYDEMEKLAANEKPNKYLIDCSDPSFGSLGNYIEKLYKNLEKQGVYCKLSDAELIRCVYDSLTTSISNEIKKISNHLNLSNDKLYVIGGGVKDKLFCILLSNQLNMEVVCGPSEGTSVGNALVQFISNKKIRNIKEARGILANTITLKSFKPNEN